MTQLYLFEKEQVMKNKDYVSDIMQKWYDAMDKHNIGVQPKCVTILGTILAEYEIKLKNKPSKEDLFDQYMNTNAGEFDAFWNRLSEDEKLYIETRRQQMRDKYYAERNLQDDNRKALLKG
tara:strand:+ start:323 stop:685 length:363 start_codon:yes stop_codon:yes gene_type:complete